MAENQRDVGLVRAVGPWAFAASIVSIIVGAGIFAVPAALAACVGPYAPLAFLACGFAVGAVAAALADVFAGLIPQPAAGTARAAVIVGVIGGVATVNIGGVARGARLVSATTALKLAPLAFFIVAGTALSMFGWLGSDILGSPRQLFAFGRDGLLPRVLGRLHPRTHTPYVAILCYATLAIVLALTGTFAELVVLATLASAVLYIVGCAASWTLARRGVALCGPPLNFRFLGAATVIGIGSMLTLIALGSREEIIGLATLIGLSILLYLVQTRSALARPE